MTEYKLRKRAQACMVSGRPFAPGETVVSAIYEDDDEGFVRRDMCEEAFKEAGTPFSYWRSQHPEPVEDTRRVDYDLALSFLARLLEEADPAQTGLVYILTLLLSRKRRVKIRATRPLPDGDLLTVVVPGAEEDDTVQVRAPQLDAGQAAELQAALARLFDFAGPGEGGDAEADREEPEER